MKSIVEIPLINLAASFIPVLMVGVIFYFWKLEWKTLAYSTIRMLSQLLMIGYFLNFIFNQSHSLLTILILIIMITISSWIALFSIKDIRMKHLKHAFLSLLFGALPVLILVTTVVIPKTFWLTPSFIIPLAGMIFSNSMNTISLAAERFRNEIQTHSYLHSRKTALSAALIPQINSFMAVGLVALPGMMTGQILAGIDPLLAVRYQVVVMTMVLGSGGISAAIFLHLYPSVKS